MEERRQNILVAILFFMVIKHAIANILGLTLQQLVLNEQNVALMMIFFFHHGKRQSKKQNGVEQ
jgi:integral membrane sensor domain MASE1